ncbi:hypothetical protein FCULG_00009331 [Fusarium culmorum]|uniref:PhnB-like domain-containing protein n=1 Tax=Fusarium culmorum TaxID=5516 RepID=A0A2T4GHA7_FUSCU|nr:hypothetical protein FCULG_00009331 [Fusarium culmorum]
MPFERITTCLWFQDQAEEAANYYVTTFAPYSKINTLPGQETERVMAVEFELQGRTFVALNGGAVPWQFNEAISMVVNCKDQAEVDYYWEKLSKNGDASRQQSGWLADKYGNDVFGDKAGVGRLTAAMMKMKKFDIAELEKAFKG